jgi:beta-glucanase (GH16 family)
MKKIIWILLFYLAFAQFASAQPAELNGKIRFSWGDEFNGTAVNTDMWKITDNDDNNGDGNGAIAIARNTWVAGGLLNCKVVAESYTCPAGFDGNCTRQKDNHGLAYNYTYGRIQSKQKYNQQYGYVEASMYFNPQPGMWPAFWTFVGDGHPIPNANAAEFDIMERPGFFTENNTVSTNVHLSYCPKGTGTDCPDWLGKYCSSVPDCYGIKYYLANPVWNATKYALYWSPTELVFYINDVRVKRMDNPGVVDPVMFILGMGVSADNVTGSTILPSVFYVDYIHVYDLYDCLNNTTVAIGQTLVSNNSPSNIVVACTKVDGNGTTGGKLISVARSSVALLPNFSVKQGGSLEARIGTIPGSAQSTDEELPRSENNQFPLHMQGHSNMQVVSEKAVVQDVFTVSPNPIVNTAHINYSIAKQAPVKITLYNMMGITQAELVNENQFAGEYTYELDASNYNAGTYLLVFESGGSKQKRVVVITK